MKKLLSAVTAVCLITLVSAISCKKDHPVDCNATVNKISDAANAYAADQSTENCKAYKAALQEFVNSSCFTSASAEEKAAYQDAVDALACP